VNVTGTPSAAAAPIVCVNTIRIEFTPPESAPESGPKLDV